MDLETGQLTVRARVNRLRKGLGGLVVRTGAKSDAGGRTTYVASFVIDALRRQRAWVRQDAHKSFKRACEHARLGGEQTFHGLRHDFASLLAKLGVPLRVAMDMLGHSPQLMTIYYQHASHADRREAADKVGFWLRETVGRGALT
jgi:integrase